MLTMVMWTVLEQLNADYVLSADASAPSFRGILGLPMFIRPDVPLRVSDLTYLVLPSLTLLGFQAQLLPFVEFSSNEPDSVITVFVLGNESRPLILSPEDATHDTLNPDEEDPTIRFEARVRQEPGMELEWRTAKDAFWSPAFEQDWPALQLTTTGSWVKRLSVTRMAPLFLRWCALYAANPERLISGENRELCEEASRFFSSASSLKSDRFSTRLRRTANAFENCNVDEAFFHLLEGTLAEIAAPSSVQSGLLKPCGSPLVDVERRELLYFARAGTDALRALAARRLTYDAENPDVSRTLAQLAYDRCMWVRHAATA